ncbi:hypothetical protein [Allosphingosinicella deserti]|uniref:Uncharacterized protein n=1 Tax=Allosphingosinicella deserti TaxID=2116704 RepID=A0A2P7QR93_9SPHN|nr:hypothetical protein [Sphingomonas deserti]PSJ40459.1 hypothetical protein C7I55_08975 [Sphingomonas deserti]
MNLSVMLAASAATATAKVGKFCDGYSDFLFNAGKWTLILSILLGILLAAAAVVSAWRQPAPAVLPRGAAPGPTAILDAIKSFIQALSTAPTWLALFGGGLLLLWMAATVVPQTCQPGRNQNHAAQQSGGRVLPD